MVYIHASVQLPDLLLVIHTYKMAAGIGRTRWPMPLQHFRFALIAFFIGSDKMADAAAAAALPVTKMADNATHARMLTLISNK